MDTHLNPMLCGSTEAMPAKPDEWAMEGKIDGWRFIVSVELDGSVRAFARSGAEYSGKLPYVEAALAELLPPGTAVDGELMGPDGWGDVQGTMTRGNGPHEPNIHAPALTYCVFDITRYAGRDYRKVEWENRRTALEIALGEAREHVIVNPVGEASMPGLEALLTAGLEGAVFKRRTSAYVAGRSAAWLKYKPQITCEVVVLGFEPGEGKFAGHVGAVRFRMDTGVESTCSGMNDEVRSHMTTHGALYLGKTMEIRHHGIMASGKPRHPQYHRMRSGADLPIQSAPRPPRTAPRASRRPSSKPWMRNYGAMNDAKLRQCLAELKAQRGDAFTRVMDKGGEVGDHIDRAEEVLRSRGMTP